MGNTNFGDGPIIRWNQHLSALERLFDKKDVHKKTILKKN